MKVSPILNYLFCCCCLLLLIQCTSEKNINNSSQNQQTKMIYSGSTGNVKLYGAKGDGVTNDTEAFQKAIDAITLVSNNGQTKVFSNIVYIPCGVYLIDGLTIGRGVTIQGEGTNCVELVLNQLNGTLIQSKRNTKHNQHIKIRNITLRGNGTGIGIDLIYANFDSHIKECVISDFETNIKLESCWDFLIDDCHIDDAKGYNIKAYNITASTISNCRIDDAGKDNVVIRESQIGTGVTASVSLLHNSIQRAKRCGLILDKVLLPKVDNCFFEGNNIGGGHPFINVIGNVKGTQMFSMSSCYFTTAGKSYEDSYAINFSNNTKVASIRDTYLGSRLKGDFKTTKKLLKLIVSSCQNNVKKPYSSIFSKTDVVYENNYHNQKKGNIIQEKSLRKRGRIQQGKNNPIGKIIPTYLGEEYLDEKSGHWYKASSLDVNGWKRITL